MIRRLYPAGTFTGNYQPRGDVTVGDCIIVHTFGNGPDNTPGKVNEQLMQHAVGLRGQLGDIALIASKEVAAVDPDQPSHILDGDLANWVGQGTGTWGELLQACDIMDASSLSSPILVAHSYHVGRVASQAIKLGIDPIVPPNLPSDFDPDSTQSWTRGSVLWTARTVPGNFVLALQSKL